jgi:two-component system response regulator DevR
MDVETGGMSAQNASRPITVMIVDDHPLVREGLTERLSAIPGGVVVVGEAGDIATALEQVAELQPDVAVVDVQLPDGSGLDLCRRIAKLSAATRCVIHTATKIDPAVARNAGAESVVLKNLFGNDLITAIQQITNETRPEAE